MDELGCGRRKIDEEDINPHSNWGMSAPARAFNHFSRRQKSRKAWLSRVDRATYCCFAARIEEEVVITERGCRVIAPFLVETLPIASAY
jgi:hypothetical protein